MQVLENGTNSASYASAYFANSATVTPNGDQYTVTSTVTTDTSLGDYPVQMLSIDGSGVTTSRSQSGNKQTITYSFVTSDLKHGCANIKVDVDSINYHHNYTVGLVLDTANVPAPAASVTSADSTAASTSVAAVASSQTTTTSHVAATSSSHETREATSSATQATTAESVTTNSATETSASSASASTSTTSTAGNTDSEAHAATSASAHKSTKAAKKSAPAQQKSADQTTDQAAAFTRWPNYWCRSGNWYSRCSGYCLFKEALSHAKQQSLTWYLISDFSWVNSRLVLAIPAQSATQQPITQQRVIVTTNAQAQIFNQLAIPLVGVPTPEVITKPCQSVMQRITVSNHVAPILERIASLKPDGVLGPGLSV